MILGYRYDDEIYCVLCFEKLKQQEIEQLKQQGYTDEEIEDTIIDIETEYFLEVIFKDENLEEDEIKCLECHKRIN